MTAALLLVSGCSNGEPDTPAATETAQATDLNQDPQPGGGTVPEADTEGRWLPLVARDMQLLDPGWDAAPVYADQVFVGSQDDGQVQTYTAVNIYGEILWSAQRPSGSGPAELRTNADERTDTDTDTDDDTAADAEADADETVVAVLPEGEGTVSGFDLHTGAPVWGPSKAPGDGESVPGPTATSPEGTVISDMATQTTLYVEGTTLRAEDTPGNQLWEISLVEDADVVGVAGGLLYIREGDSIRAHNVVTGALAQAYDPDGSGRVVVPVQMVTQGATLLMDGGHPLLAAAPPAPPPPPSPPAP